MICRPCARDLRKEGRHRAHQCAGDIIGESAAFVCACECNAVSSSFQPPMMAMDYTPLDELLDTP